MTSEQEEQDRLELELLALLLTYPAIKLIDLNYGQTLSQADIDKATKQLADARLYGWDYVKNNSIDAKLGEKVYISNDAQAWAIASIPWLIQSRDEIAKQAIESYDEKLTIEEKERIVQKTLDTRRQGRAESYANTAVNQSVEMAKFGLVGLLAGAGLKTTKKTWRTVGDKKVRHSHEKANGQSVGLTEFFEVGGYDMMHPRDQRAPIKETANCRCSTVYNIKWSK